MHSASRPPVCYSGPPRNNLENDSPCHLPRSRFVFASKSRPEEPASMESKTGALAEVVFLDQSPVVRYVRRSPLVNIYIYIFISGLRPLLTRLPSRPFHAILRSVNDGPTLSSSMRAWMTGIWLLDLVI